eukprot:1608562-Pleurochrysis_carterae.AAC.1
MRLRVRVRVRVRVGEGLRGRGRVLERQSRPRKLELDVQPLDFGCPVIALGAERRRDLVHAKTQSRGGQIGGFVKQLNEQRITAEMQAEIRRR